MSGNKKKEFKWQGSTEFLVRFASFVLLHSISVTGKKKKQTPLKKYILQLITHVWENLFNAFVGHDTENKSWWKQAESYTEVHK